MYKLLPVRFLFILFMIVLSAIYLGFLQTLAIILGLAILSSLVPVFKRIVIVLLEFIEFIILSPFKLISGDTLRYRTYNPLISLVQADLGKLFKRIIS